MSAESKDVKAENPLCMGITTKPRVYLTPDREQMMINFFTDSLIERASLGYACPQIKSKPSVFEGVMLIELYDQPSKNLLQDTVQFTTAYMTHTKKIKFENIPDLDINFIKVCDLPKCRKCSLSVDSSILAWDIHTTLIKQNSRYQMDFWYYYGAEKKNNSVVTTLTYYVPEKTLAKVKDNNCEVSFGFKIVKLLIHPEV